MMMNNVIEIDFPRKQNRETAVVIPARIGSSRFPEKMLKDVGGMTLIEKVFKQCQNAYSPNDVFVATDSKKIAELFKRNEVIMTSPDCLNGTERCADAIHSPQLSSYDYVINVQGDMVKFPEHVIEDIRRMLLNGDHVVTVVKFMEPEDQQNPNTVKCINNCKEAHWFGRAAIEYGDWHLGIYGYSKQALASYPFMIMHAEELNEQLEQLRWIQNGQRIAITYTHQDAAEINTREDLTKWLSTL